MAHPKLPWRWGDSVHGADRGCLVRDAEVLADTTAEGPEGPDRRAAPTL